MKPTHCLFVAASFVVSPSTLHAAIYNWASATAGGDYSLTTNWSPAAPAGGPGSVDTAVLTDVTSGTRVVAYDNAAAATIQQLDFNQTTAGAINQFNILKTGTITNAVTLAATAGTEEIRFSSASAFTFTLGNALTVNTGGLLNFNSATGLDGRFQVNGNFTVAGGEVKNTSGFSTTLVLQGGTNSISPTGAFGSNIAISMAGGNQTLASTVALNNILLRGSGALVKTISGTSVGRIAFINAANNGSTTLKLGSNLTSSSLPFAENFSQGATVNFGIDTGAGFTLDLTGNTGTYTPNIGFQTGGAASVTNYNFTGTGKIRATNFDLRTANQVNIGAGTTLEATTITANATVNLGGGGIIDPTSTFIYNYGDAASTTSNNVLAPVTLNTNRNLGNVHVARGGLKVADANLGFLNGNPTSTLLIGTAATPNAANSDSSNVGFTVTSGTTGQVLTLSRGIDFSQTPTSFIGRQRLTFDSSLTADTSTLTIGGSIALPNTAGRTVRQEFTVLRSGQVLSLTGQITGNNSSGFLINGGNSGLGSVRLSNATSTFSVPITVVMGSLLVANNVAVSGASALGTIASVSLADGATPTFATSFDSNPAFLIDGAFTVNRGVSLANAASSGAPNSYVIGGNTAAVSSLVGNVTVGSTVPDKLLNLTQATGGTFTHSGVINPNADSTGKLNVEINAPKGLSSGSNAGNYQFSRNAGTVVLTGNSTYDGSTTVSAGTLQVSGSISGSSNVVVNTGSTLLFGGTTVTDRINNSAPVNLNGGTLLTAGFSETTGILTLTGTNVIDMGGGASVLQFANSSGALWGGSLMVWNWSGTATGGGTDQLRFGNSGAGLTTTPQVASVSFLDPAGFAAGTYPATLLGSGELVPVPEPSALFTAGTALAAAFRRRRR